ncbi:MAG TPA: aldolase/citrate lyase family protein [Dongiaceae bacterium]
MKSKRNSPARRQPLIGCWITSPNPWACEMAAAIGYSAILIDLEHGTINVESADRLIALGRALGLTVYVRVASPDRVPIQQTLDAGAHGIILPQVRDLEHARIGSSYAKYPKLGLRGMGTPRSLNYGDTPADFVAAENKNTRCLVMIETPGALRDVAEIAALNTVDGLFMGPYDLSLTRGRGQYIAGAEDRKDADWIAGAAAKAGKLLGMPVGDAKGMRRARSYGAGLISIGEDLAALNAGLRQAFDLLVDA